MMQTLKERMVRIYFHFLSTYAESPGVACPEPAGNVDDIFSTSAGADARHGETSDDSWLTANADSYGNTSGGASSYGAYSAAEGSVMGGEAGYDYPADDNAQLYEGYYDENGEWHTHENQGSGTSPLFWLYTRTFSL